MKKLIFLSIILFIFLLPIKTNAIIVGLYKPGDSLKGEAKIGYNYVGSGYYNFASGTTDLSDFILDADFQPDFTLPSVSGTKLFHFTVDLCINGSLPSFYITSVYENYVDYIYPLGTYQYVASGDWARTNCYRAFIRLNLNYYLNLGTQGTGNDFLELSNNNNWFNVTANYGYNSILRYEDLVYYLEDQYNALLTDARNLGGNNTIINQNDTIINNQQDIKDDLTDETLPSTANWLDSWTNLLLENNNINQLLYIPVNILTKIRTGLSGNCQNVTIPFGITGGDETLTFKCWKVTDYIGNTVGDLITGFVGFYLIYYFALFLWKFYDHFTSMRDTLALIMGNEDTLIVRGDE